MNLNLYRLLEHGIKELTEIKKALQTPKRFIQINDEYVIQLDMILSVEEFDDYYELCYRNAWGDAKIIKVADKTNLERLKNELGTIRLD